MNKIAGLMIIAVAGGPPAGAGEIRSAEGLRVVTICMERPADLHLQRGADIQLMLAQPMAAKAFATAGVRIDWRGARGRPDAAILISLSTDPNNRTRPFALGYALPYEGIHIMIFGDRVQKVVE